MDDQIARNFRDACKQIAIVVKKLLQELKKIFKRVSLILEKILNLEISYEVVRGIAHFEGLVSPSFEVFYEGYRLLE